MGPSSTLALRPQNPRITGIAIALLGTLLMSFDPIFIRLSGVSGFDTAFLFGLFTAISMSAFIQLRDQRGLIEVLKAGGWPILLSGLLILGSTSALVPSIKNTSVANTFVILSTSPALAALISWFFLKEITRRSMWISIVFVMLGIAIVVSGSFGSGNLKGDLLALFAVICLSLNQTLLRKYQDVSRMASVGLGGLFLARVMAIVAEPSGYSLSTWVIMGAMGLFTAPFGREMSAVATRDITAPEVGMILMTEVVFAQLFAFEFFGVIPPAANFVGGAVIIVTVLIYAELSAKQEK